MHWTAGGSSSRSGRIVAAGRAGTRSIAGTATRTGRTRTAIKDGPSTLQTGTARPTRTGWTWLRAGIGRLRIIGRGRRRSWARWWWRRRVNGTRPSLRHNDATCRRRGRYRLLRHSSACRRSDFRSRRNRYRRRRRRCLCHSRSRRGDTRRYCRYPLRRRRSSRCRRCCDRRLPDYDA